MAVFSPAVVVVNPLAVQFPRPSREGFLVVSIHENKFIVKRNVN